MNFFSEHSRKIAISALVFFLIVIIISSSKEYGDANPVENKTGGVFAPIQNFFYGISYTISDTLHSIGSVSYVKKENQELKKKLAFLEENNRLLNDLVAKEDYLRKEYELKKNKKYDYLRAEIIAKDPGNWFNNFTVNKGKKQGVAYNDMVVLGSEIEDGVIVNGVVGRVSEVGDDWSKIIGIIDYGSSVSVKVVRTQDNGIVSGSMEQNLTGYMFDNKSDIVIGDKIVTSGIGEAYLKDIYVGEVVEVEKSDDYLVKKIVVKPTIDFKKINQLLILKDNNVMKEGN